MINTHYYLLQSCFTACYFQIILFFFLLDNTNIKISSHEPQSCKVLETFVLNIFYQQDSPVKSLHFTFSLCSWSCDSSYPEDNASTL